MGIFSDGFKLSNEWTAQIDASDLTWMSIRKANKRSRTIKITNEEDSMMRIKMYGLYCKNGHRDLLFKIQTSKGEYKSMFSKLIVDNLQDVGKFIILDSQSKFNDLKELGIFIFHPQKNNKHCHNSQIEAMFGTVKKLVYRNIEKIEKMDIKELLEYLEKIKNLVLYYEKPLEIKDLENTELLEKLEAKLEARLNQIPPTIN
jgi:hypothetical protein